MSDKRKLHPSKANQWGPGGCAGSAMLQQALPPDTSPKHPVTQEGIALAWACDRVMASWPTAAPLNMAGFLGQACPENGVVVDDDMLYGGELYLRTVWGYAHEHLPGLRTEHQVSPHQYIENNGGRLDSAWLNLAETHLVVLDLKYGYRAVSAFENWQLVNYALGVWRDTLATVTLIIVQPRGSSASNPIKTWELNAGQFSQEAERLIVAAEEAQGGNPRITAGPACYYCRAAPTCGVQRQAGMGAIESSLKPINVELTNEALAHELELIERHADILKNRATALRGLGVARIEAGGKIPGYSYEMSLGNREWGNGINVRGLGKLNDVELTTSKPVTPAEAERRGVPRATIDLFTIRHQRPADLKRIRVNEARDIFKQHT